MEQRPNEIERTLVNALVDYTSRNPTPEVIARCRLITTGVLGTSKRYDAAWVTQKDLDDVMGSVPVDTIKVPKKRDRTLLKRALAALLLRKDSDADRRAQVESLANDIGINPESIDDEMEEMNIPEIPERNLEWRSGDGRSVKIKDMEDSHLMNAIRFMERSAKTDQAGELLIMHALMAYKPSPHVKAGIDKAMRAEKPDAPAMYWIMRREATRRGMSLPPAATKADPPKEKDNTPRVAKPGARAFTLD
jgi:hypothetical protein